MMPYAHNGQISQMPIEGGVEITDQEYAHALEGMLEGKVVTIEGGFKVDFPPEPEPPEPEEPAPPGPLSYDLPRREFRRALLHNGMDTAAVLSVINAIPDALEREEMLIWWEDTTLFQRQHPVLVAMVDAAGLSPAEGDGIWTYGVGLLLAPAP